MCILCSLAQRIMKNDEKIECFNEANYSTPKPVFKKKNRINICAKEFKNKKIKMIMEDSGV